MTLHTLLGANGTIATELLPILQAKNENIRLVSRRQKPVPGTESIQADLLNYDQVMKAVQGSDIVYLLVGITYNAKIWARDWPVIMQHVIKACIACNAKLVFFDNVYMYGRVKGPMTEDTPYKPISKKGEVRAEIAEMLQKEMESGTLKAIIARAVDFYGPGVREKSAAGILVFSNIKKRKKAQWFINPDVPRSYNYTPDAALAVYMLASDETAFGQIWHLPSARPALTGRQFIRLAAKYMTASEKVQVLPKWLLKIISWFNPFLREAYEMNYQDEYPFEFDSSKFEKVYNFTPTSYEVGVKVTAEWFLAHD